MKGHLLIHDFIKVSTILTWLGLFVSFFYPDNSETEKKLERLEVELSSLSMKQEQSKKEIATFQAKDKTQMAMIKERETKIKELEKELEARNILVNLFKLHRIILCINIFSWKRKLWS